MKKIVFTILLALSSSNIFADGNISDDNLELLKQAEYKTYRTFWYSVRFAIMGNKDYEMSEESYDTIMEIIDKYKPSDLDDINIGEHLQDNIFIYNLNCYRYNLGDTYIVKHMECPETNNESTEGEVT